MKIDNFFAELKRRNVYKVAIAYAVVGWLLVQITTQVFPIFEIPNWALRLIVLAIIIGFPIALVMAWAFELTPEGIKHTEDVDLSDKRVSKNRTWIYVIVDRCFHLGRAIFLGPLHCWKRNASTERGGCSDSREIDCGAAVAERKR